MGSPGGSEGKESACNVGDLGSIPGLGRSPGGGHGNPLHILAWRIPMDRGAWRAADHGLTQSRTRLSDGAHTSSPAHSEAGSTGGAPCLSSRLTPVLLCPLQMLVAVEHQGCSDAVTLDDTVMHQSEPSGAEEKAVLCPSRKDSHLSSPVLCFVIGDMNISACVPVFQWFFMKIILVVPLSVR